MYLAQESNDTKSPYINQIISGVGYGIVLGETDNKPGKGITVI